MRIPVLARILLALLVVASPALVRAQFQKPTNEELKMTDDPKAPGAAAVYLGNRLPIEQPASASGA